jgi:hypothetical protein
VNKALTGVLVIVIIAAIGGAYYFGKNGLTISFNKVTPTPTPTQLVGNDRDEHGCIPSAGYSWCDSKQKCLRPWEEDCPSPTATAASTASLVSDVKAALIAEHGQNAANLNITVSKVEGNYAQGGASEEGAGGGMWFAAYVDGTWKLVWDGNGIIYCSDLTAYPNFPKDMIPECIDKATGNTVTR